MSSEHVYIEVVTTDSPTIHISFLGKMTIEQAGQPVIKLSGQKVTALLAYLVCNPGPHTRIQLADLLWDDIPYDRFLPNLRSTLNRLPKVIKPYIKTTRQTVAFEPTPAVWVDAVALQSLVTSLPNPENLPKGPYFIQLATVKDSLITTVDCYNEPFLDEMDLVDAPRFSDWQFAQQETLEQHYLHGLRVLMALADHEGDNESCIGYAKHIIELDPVDEQVRRQLIMLYARMGEYQAAINEYEGLVQDLRDMLGVSPSPETVAAYQRIESGHHPDTLVVSTFPTFAQPLVGRKHELDTLCHQLQEPQHRLVTVTGMGGVGKTHLAVEAAKMIAHPPHACDRDQTMLRLL
ncbi:MAG: BTAD domain-containing putative transcriptional regulator [Chloroflexota bacterium]